MEKYKLEPLKDNVEEMFIGPFGSSLKNDCFVDEKEAFCMVYEQKHAIKKTMNVETRYVNENKYNELKRFNVRSGDIIVSCRGTIGETFVIPDNAPFGIMHPSIMKIRLKKDVYDKNYFNHLLCKRLKKHEVEANGSGVKMAISAKKLGEELFPVPTIQQQKNIEKKLALVLNVIDQRKKLLLAMDNLIKARFVEMFGDLNTNPMGWELKAFEEITELITDGEHATPRRSDKGIYLLSARNVLNHSLQLDDVDYIDEEEYERISKRIVPQAGDVLLSCSGTVGRCCCVPEGLRFQMVRSTAILRFKDILNPIFAEYMITSDFVQKQIDKAKTASSQANLFQGKIAKLKGFVPPIELQDDFLDFVKQVDKSKVAVQKSLEEMQLLFDSLMQEYFG
ncbi:MAG: restriction endonuclease subunit S [Lachnospiraceae bacterium]|nr:restriction endonuclease subunit S [Lachnospiraceae bacterium]